MLGETGRQVQSPAPDSARGLVAGLSRARRRGTILVGAAIAIPAVTLGAVTVGLAVANSREADRALLTAEQFGQIRVGDARTDIGHLLPRYTLPRPDGGRPGCDYFAITTNPFADEFEDAYEICWDQDLVVSTALVEGAAR
ncbi:hypothetical protein ET495_08340 [Xylanimonas allomyrinae]|uniref:Sensor histidine kinase n=1 Tax=Xylanimonas allomyrinae TaxID=2509459 RepID=A0A4P6EKT5_9MICO|nr:hypothetical protein [Xylanimonas allomyrinae]QAY63252.1 hypothetical protein ET495_08340 [Xylanimonas allomyrinae]